MEQHSFAFDLQQPGDSISQSPGTTETPSSQQSPQKSSRERGWSASTEGSKLDYGHKASSSWEAPPVPPIPHDEPSEAWRRRSLKRDSYTSQMSMRRNESMISLPVPAAVEENADDAIRHSAPANGAPSPRGRKRTSRLAMGVREKCQYEELHWQVSGLNPKGWSRRRKWMHTLAAGGVASTVLFSSSIVAPARATIEDSFSASPVVAVLSTALYILGLALGSMLGNASAALVGRRVTQLASLLLCVAFTIASACVDSFAALHACRFIAGLFASPALWISLAILLEMWRTEKLAMPLIAFTTLALAGLTLGPVAGSYIIQSQSARWTQYTIIIACAVALALVLAMRETHKNTVQRSSKPSPAKTFEIAVASPLAALFRTPTVLLLSIYAGTILGTFYTACTAFLSVFAAAYEFSLPEQGLTILALLVGVLMGAILLALDQTLIYSPRVAQWRQHYDAEVERALAEEKHLKRRSRRNSRASSHKLQKRKSSASLFPSNTPQAGSRISLVQAFTKRESRSDLISMTIDFEDKNVALSVAAAEYLNSVDEKRILPERVLLILSRQPPFGEMCDHLESYGLRFDRVKLAQVFLDALQQQAETRPATANTPQDSVQRMPGSTLNSIKSSATLSHTSPTFKAPPVWRLWPALPASVLAAAGLFLFAWTANDGVHWMVPIVGLSVLAIGGSMVLVSSMLYILEKYGDDAVAGGSFAMWLLAAVFPIFSVPMFSVLESSWAGSVLGLITLLCAIPVWVVVLKGRAG